MVQYKDFIEVILCITDNTAWCSRYSTAYVWWEYLYRCISPVSVAQPGILFWGGGGAVSVTWRTSACSFRLFSNSWNWLSSQVCFGGGHGLSGLILPALLPGISTNLVWGDEWPVTFTTRSFDVHSHNRRFTVGELLSEAIGNICMLWFVALPGLRRISDQNPLECYVWLSLFQVQHLRTQCFKERRTAHPVTYGMYLNKAFGRVGCFRIVKASGLGVALKRCFSFKRMLVR